MTARKGRKSNSIHHLLFLYPFSFPLVPIEWGDRHHHLDSVYLSPRRDSYLKEHTIEREKKAGLSYHHHYPGSRVQFFHGLKRREKRHAA